MSNTFNQSKASGTVHRCMPTLLCVCVCVFQIQEYRDLCVGTCGHNDLLFKASSTHLEAVWTRVVVNNSFKTSIFH